MSADTVTVLLRVALATWAMVAAVTVPVLYRRSHDENRVPWIYAACVYVVYTIMVLVVIAGSDLVLEDWWRPMFSTMNINLIVASLWLLWRTTRRPPPRFLQPGWGDE